MIKIKSLLSLLIVLGLLFMSSYTFALEDDDNTTIVINPNGEYSSPGFDGTWMSKAGPWYPGRSVTKKLTVINNSNEAATLSNIGMTLSDVTNQAYLENMHISITAADQTIFDADFNQLDKAESKSLALPNGESLELFYTITMNPKAGIEVAGASVKADFTITVAGNQISSGGGGGGGGTTPAAQLVEEPEEEMPSIFAVSDIDGHWAQDCIRALMQHGVIRGYEDGTIRPNKYITRAEAAVLLARAFKLEENPNAANIYKDELPAWAKGAIMATSRAGVFRGYPGNLFKPDQLITREEMICALTRAFNKKLVGDFNLPFTDQDQIGAWALADVKAGVQQEVIGGYPDNTLKPQQNITRAETFSILCRLLGYHQEHVK